MGVLPKCGDRLRYQNVLGEMSQYDNVSDQNKEVDCDLLTEHEQGHGFIRWFNTVFIAFKMHRGLFVQLLEKYNTKIPEGLWTYCGPVYSFHQHITYHKDLLLTY